MSIEKLFVKVFGEELFAKISHLSLVQDEHQDCLETKQVERLKREDMVLTEQLVVVKSWLQVKMDVMLEEAEMDNRAQRQTKIYRLGPDLACFDIDYNTTVRTSTDRLSVRSQGAFNTVKANCCVFGGSWMYEVKLHSKGVMQLGWCSNKCQFNDNSGVGDSKYSYGYDGSKQKLWHVSTAKYGDKWQIGDIIGVTIDLDNERIEFYRNGTSMGMAFNKLDKGPGLTYYPAVSLGFNQALQINFGNMPFSYPIEGYMPLQAKPIQQLYTANLLMPYLVNLAAVVGQLNCCRDSKKQKDHKVSTKQTVYIIFSEMLIQKLTPVLFEPYVVYDVLLAHITQLAYDNSSDILPGAENSSLGTLLSLLWNFLENDEQKFVLKKLVNALLGTYTHTHPGFDYSQQIKSIYVLNAICRHSRTRKTLIEYKFFKKNCLALFMNLPPPDFKFMKELIPDAVAWTEALGNNKSKYMSTVERMRKSVEPLYNAQLELLFNLLANDDGDEHTPSSRKIFLAKMRRYVIDIGMEQRPFHTFFFMQSSIQHPVESQIALSFFCILVDAARTLYRTELANSGAERVNPKFFYDGSFEYQHFDRLGGVLSHLRKLYRGEIQQRLGSERTQLLMEEERTVVRVAELDAGLFPPPPTNALPFRRLPPPGEASVGPSIGFSQFFNPRLSPIVEPRPGNSDTEASVHELIDIAAIYYYSIAHKYVVKISCTRDEIASLNESLMETEKNHTDIARKSMAIEHSNELITDLRDKFRQRKHIFIDRSIELARKQAWFRAVALGTYRRNIIIWHSERILYTLNTASDLGPLFTFVPEVYINILPILLDTVMDFSFHDLETQFEIGDGECMVNTVAEFLGYHTADSRIIIASCKDSLLQALGTLTCHKSGIRALERAPKKSQAALVKALLRPYENRAWGQSNWLLLRFWMGDGFAYRDARHPSIWQGGNEVAALGLCRSRAKNETHTGLLHNVAPPNPSKYFQKLIGSKLNEDEPYATAFLNSVLSQLNWAFSEFILLLQETQNIALRQENTVFDPKQMKVCSMCFDLTVSLMRCLEMTISVAPQIFQDQSRPNCDLVLNRICQLINQVLSRVTVPPGCFQFVVDMCSSDLNTVTHFPIISAAVGILLALMRYEMNSDKQPAKVTRITRALLTDSSFQFAHLEFALGEIKTPILEQSEIPRGNFDPQNRAHIDPLTNDVRVPMPNNATKRVRSDPPIIKFSLLDFPTHVSRQEVNEVRRLIECLRVTQSLLSDIALPSEDSLCPICCAKPIAVTFYPCKHQSCSHCILQHLMNSKVCFYCKSLIEKIEANDGTVIYQSTDFLVPQEFLEVDDQEGLQ